MSKYDPEVSRTVYESNHEVGFYSGYPKDDTGLLFEHIQILEKYIALLEDRVFVLEERLSGYSDYPVECDGCSGECENHDCASQWKDGRIEEASKEIYGEDE